MNSHQKGLHLNLIHRNMDVSNFGENKKPPLCKGRWVCEANSEGLKKSKTIPQSATLTAPFTQDEGTVLLYWHGITHIKFIKV